jgi:hypothetical protein
VCRCLGSTIVRGAERRKVTLVVGWVLQVLNGFARCLILGFAYYRGAHLMFLANATTPLVKSSQTGDF